VTEFDAEQRGDRDLVAALERSLPRVTPSATVLEGILAEVGSEAHVLPLRRRRRRRVLAVASAAAAAAAAVAVAVGVAVHDDDSPAARAALEAAPGATVTGAAALYGPRSDGGHLVVSLRDVPPAPSGHHYEVWVLPAGSDAMLSVGTFDPDTTGDVELDLPLPQRGSYAAVDVSVEEDGGPAAHSDTSIATGAFDAA
jgi:anti-sigma-K factor RskA